MSSARVECVRPLCSATVFMCNSIACFVDGYTQLVWSRYEYSWSEALDLDLDRELEINATIVRKYIGNAKLKYVVIGTPSGGGVHLASMLRTILIPSNVLIPVSRGATYHPDDVDSYLSQALEIARIWSKRFGDVADVIIHYDPIHDRNWVSRNLTLRIHLKDLPKAYRDLLRDMLDRNARIVLIDVEHRWLQFDLGNNIFVQIGGANDIKDIEYVEYSERVIEIARELGLDLARYPWTSRILDSATRVYEPESEWGTRRDFVKNMRSLADELGLEVIEIRLSSFYELSYLGTALALSIYGYDAWRGIVVDNYKACSFRAYEKHRLLPIWSVFTTRRSLEIVKKMIEHLSNRIDIERILYVTVPYGYREQGHRWPDSTSFSEWIEMFKRFSREVAVIPSVIQVGASTRTLDAMNAMYREAWEYASRGSEKLEKEFELDRNELAKHLDLFRSLLS